MIHLAVFEGVVVAQFLVNPGRDEGNGGAIRERNWHFILITFIAENRQTLEGEADLAPC